MPLALTLPDLRRTLDDLARRIGILERRVTPRAPAPVESNGQIPFSYAGELAADTESPPLLVRHDGVLQTLAVALGTAGSTSTVLEVERNGTVIGTATLGSGVTDLVETIDVEFDAEDKISLRIDSAGTGAADMTAGARFS